MQASGAIQTYGDVERRINMITEKEIYNAFGVPPELFKDGTTYQKSAKIQSTQFLEMNKPIKIDVRDKNIETLKLGGN